jgi:hypothetical protein
MKDYKEIKDLAARILNLGTRNRWVVTMMTDRYPIANLKQD